MQRIYNCNTSRVLFENVEKQKLPLRANLTRSTVASIRNEKKLGLPYAAPVLLGLTPALSSCSCNASTMFSLLLFKITEESQI